jgi:asparagine N-glycosylation enzyme membrane subunit Stt3
MSVAYVIRTTTNVTLAAAGTAKTLVNLIAGSNITAIPTALHVSINGTDIAKEPFLIEICSSTQGAAGTSTGATPTQVRGKTRTVQSSGAIAYTAEPTTITVLYPHLLSPAGGHFSWQYPLGREPEVNAAGFLIRATVPSGTTGTFTAQAWIEFEE